MRGNRSRVMEENSLFSGTVDFLSLTNATRSNDSLYTLSKVYALGCGAHWSTLTVHAEENSMQLPYFVFTH